jgi:hypothetical protein
MYGIAHCLLERDGPVISFHSPEGNGALTMADLLCDLLAGVSAEQLRQRAAIIMRQIERYRAREPGEDDELLPLATRISMASIP